MRAPCIYSHQFRARSSIYARCRRRSKRGRSFTAETLKRHTYFIKNINLQHLTSYSRDFSIMQYWSFIVSDSIKIIFNLYRNITEFSILSSNKVRDEYILKEANVIVHIGITARERYNIAEKKSNNTQLAN